MIYGDVWNLPEWKYSMDARERGSVMEKSFMRAALKQMDIRGRLKDVDTVAKDSGKTRLYILLDMIRCALRYGAGPVDYRVFALYDKTPAQRETYVTRGINNALVKRWNDPAYCMLIDDKIVFHTIFSRFTRRDWLSLREMTPQTLAAFCENREQILYKPAREGCGRGIEGICVGQWDMDKLYAYLKTKPGGLLEEMVVQHPALSAIHASSVNTVRVVTLVKDGICTPLFAFLRMGMGGKVVDNLNAQGIAARLDIRTGTITLPAAGKDGSRHICHPESGAELVGFTVPHWDQVLQTVSRASAVVPQVGYVGWDVAVRQEDVLLIEGNSYPGHDILQLPAYTPEGLGLKPLVEPFLEK